ncbi:amphiphysin isoform X7 [Chiloscyllium plagiosum]|uniref:amphiphysin isoform X7 n=1 Tax=Chiloscyllium plagiosum TaxID=36176 RepID=UPI001CB83BB2|nr:amphiphysin isoform X7 [Chiloscyllium plagiosum]
MADNIKTGVFAKNVQKRLNRAQEKVLQKLGKADETRDEQFEGFVQNFKKQEAEGSRLQRELRGYLTAVKGMQEASTKLTESLHEVYEPEWYGRDDIKAVGQNCDLLWADFHQKLVDQALLTLDTYLGQFPDIKTRIAKRSRKLVDYDCARHHLESLQHSKRRDDSKLTKAEEEFQKAQKVFEELNTDLQDELPALWSSRVGFYVSTFRNISCIESKFHKEIAVLCHKLYEIMSKLGEQHADKAFSIQGAPRRWSDSGPLRISKTPTPPEEPSPPSSPVTSPNHSLAPLAPSPAHTPTRPKSPSQLRKGPPVPPPPKLTPTKELHQENIINFFEDNFVPEISVTSPSQALTCCGSFFAVPELSQQPEQPVAQPVESLLDLDFDPFKPDQSTPITRSQSPLGQTLPWDLWEASAELVQPMPSAAFNGFTQLDVNITEGATELSNQSVFDTVINAESTLGEEPKAPAAGTEPPQDALSAVPSVAAAEEVVEIKEPEVQEPAVSAETDSTEEIKEPEVQEPVIGAETESTENVTPEAETEQGQATSDDLEPSQVSVPSVVVQPASNHEGEDDPDQAEDETQDVQAEEEEKAVTDMNTSATASAPEQVEEMSSDSIGIDDSAETTSVPQQQSAAEDEVSVSQSMPPGFMYKVRALHTFEAANADELSLQRGDIVLVVPSELIEDQDAGWLTGIKESNWLQDGAANALKGLFPKNFTQQLE